MNDFDRHSRVNKFEKRRKNTKSLSILIVAGIILVIILLGIWIFGGNDDEEQDEAQDDTTEQNNDGHAENNDSDTSSNDFTTDEDNTGNNDTSGNESENDDMNSDDNDSDDVSIPSDDVDTEEVDDSDDDNVKQAYTGDWESVGTSQSEPHEVQFDKDTQDWKEMEKAIKYATGLNEMTTQRIRNGGEQKVIGTVNSPDDEIYRVYLSWQTDEGWQPTRVEILNEVDEDEW